MCSAHALRLQKAQNKALSGPSSKKARISMAIVINKPLPEFEAMATGGVQVTNISHAGQVLVLYFYPKDDTPGCTAEASHFRDQHEEFVKAGATVFGVCRDNMKSHDAFKAKLKLPFELIADTEEKMCHMFGVVKNKIMYGRKVKGIERSTFLINAEGVLVQEWRRVSVKDDDHSHVDEVLEAVRALSGHKEKSAPRKTAEKTVKKPAKSEKPAEAEKPARAEETAKAEKPAKTAKAEKPVKAQKSEKTASTAKTAKADKSVKAPKSAKAEKATQTGKTPQAVKSEKTPKTTETAKTTKTAKAAKTTKTVEAEKAAKSEKAPETAASAKTAKAVKKAAPASRAAKSASA